MHKYSHLIQSTIWIGSYLDVDAIRIEHKMMKNPQHSSSTPATHSFLGFHCLALFCGLCKFSAV